MAIAYLLCIHPTHIPYSRLTWLKLDKFSIDQTYIVS